MCTNKPIWINMMDYKIVYCLRRLLKRNYIKSKNGEVRT